jgi:hypothetical protein
MDHGEVRGLEASTARNRELAQDNQRLRRQLAQALGQLRAAGVRPDPGPAPRRSRESCPSVTIGPC